MLTAIHATDTPVIAYRWRGKWFTVAEMNAIKCEMNGSVLSDNAQAARAEALPYTQVMIERRKEKRGVYDTPCR